MIVNGLALYVDKSKGIRSEGGQRTDKTCLVQISYLCHPWMSEAIDEGLYGYSNIKPLVYCTCTSIGMARTPIMIMIKYLFRHEKLMEILSIILWVRRTLGGRIWVGRRNKGEEEG